jgi:hypothetical protein
MKKRTSLVIIVSAIVAASSAPAAFTLIEHNFGGLGTNPLNGATIDTVNITGAASTWVSDGIIAANGQVNDGTSTDRGASIDLGASFAFLADTTYTLDLAWTSLSNAIVFAGFMVNAPSVANQMQTQDTNFGIRARRITAGTDTLASWGYVSSTVSAVDGTTVTPNAGSASLTLNTNSLTDASFTVDGASQLIDLSAGYRYLWIAFEDPFAATPASDARFTSVNFTVIPEPSAAVLGSLGLLVLLRRRR